MDKLILNFDNLEEKKRIVLRPKKIHELCQIEF